MSTTGYKVQSTFIKPVISGAVAFGLSYLISPDQVTNSVVVLGAQMSVPVFNSVVSAGSCLALNTVSEWVLPHILGKEMLVNNKLVIQPLTAGVLGAGASYLVRPDYVSAVGPGEVFLLHAGAEGISTYIQPIISQYLPK
jgi:hypothetical protein